MDALVTTVPKQEPRRATSNRGGAYGPARADCHGHRPAGRAARNPLAVRSVGGKRDELCHEHDHWSIVQQAGSGHLLPGADRSSIWPGGSKSSSFPLLT